VVDDQDCRMTQIAPPKTVYAPRSDGQKECHEITF
jgi:hypothetical protein